LPSDYQSLLSSLVTAEVEHQKLVAAVAASENKLNQLRARVAVMLQQAAGSDEPPPATKVGQLKALYRRNPRITPKEAAELIEEDTEPPAMKRIYAARDYLLRTEQLKKEPDGSYTVCG
jgi:hypothetical protein